MTVLIFLVVLSVLVLAHEWGHFITAKRAGAKVEEFGFGFPPRVFAVKRGETEYSFNLIPFGGFVKIFGEQGEHHNEPGSFSYLRLAQRAKIVVAGVTMNLILAWVLLSLGNLWGKPEIISDSNEKLARHIQIQILDVRDKSPAQEAGIKVGDVILSALFNNQIVDFKDVSEFKGFIESAHGQPVELNLKRGNKDVKISAAPRLNPPIEEGPLGIALVRTGLVKSPWYLFLWQGLKDTILLVGLIASALFLFFKTLIVEGRLMGEVAGPIGIAALTGEAYRLGISYLLNLVAVLSINLALLNILPFPALDGGRLILLAVEKIKGSAVSPKWEQGINAAGFALLIALMLFVTWKDIAKFF